MRKTPEAMGYLTDCLPQNQLDPYNPLALRTLALRTLALRTLALHNPGAAFESHARDSIS
jgi:hypothetical protein